MKQYYNISIYCNILYSNTIQYGLKEILIYCNVQYIVIYCNVCCLDVVNAHNHYTTKMTGSLETWIIHLSFLCFYTVIQGVYSVLYCQNPYSHVKCLFTKIQSNIAIWQYIAIHSNTIRNTALTRIVSPLVSSSVPVWSAHITNIISISTVYCSILIRHFWILSVSQVWNL